MSSIGRRNTTTNMSPNDFMRFYHSIYTTIKFVKDTNYYSYNNSDATAAIGSAMLTLMKEVEYLYHHAQELRQRIWELDPKDQLITGNHFRESPMAMREAIQKFVQGDVNTDVGRSGVSS